MISVRRFAEPMTHGSLWDLPFNFGSTRVTPYILYQLGKIHIQIFKIIIQVTECERIRMKAGSLCYSSPIDTFSHSTCAPHTLITIFFLSNMICNPGLLYIENLSQLQPKVVFQELNHVLEIPKFHIEY